MSRPTTIKADGHAEISLPCTGQGTMTVRVDRCVPGLGTADELVIRFRWPNERSSDVREVRVPTEAVRAAMAQAGL